MKSFRQTLFFITLFLNLNLPAQQVQFIPLNVDYASFYSTDKQVYVEFYISFLQNSLSYVQTDSGYQATFTISCKIKQGDSTVYEHSESFTNLVQQETETSEYNELRQILVCELPPGDYQSSIRITDARSGRQGEYLIDLTLPDYSESTLLLSDIQLSLKISRSKEKSLFNKSGYRIIPNPSGMFNVLVPVLYYYAEVYNLLYDDKQPGQYVLETYITDKDGKLVRTFPTRTSKKPGSSAVLVGGNNIVTLSSGAYFFSVKVTDQETGHSVRKTKRFVFFKPTKEQLAQSDKAKSSSGQLMLSYYMSLTEDQLDDEFDKAGYIATREEKKVYKSLNFKGKAEFLANFWRRRDPDPSTPENEYKIRYFQLVEYANATFSTKFREGWKTDRGRVLLVYGAPNEIERNPSRVDSKPYEIWTYNDLEGGSIFVFGDLQGFGNYELLHSTYSKELNQPEWERLVLKRRKSDEIEDGL